MKLATLQDAFIEELKDLHNAENQILKALPRMAKAASSPELARAFEEHLDQTKTQVERLEQILDNAGASTRGKKCKGMEGIIEEGKDVLDLKGDADPIVLDALMIGSAQRVEHYEIAAYGTVCAFAKQLGQEDALRLLKQTLNEEEQTDKRLTQIAESHVNQMAKSSGGRKTRGAGSTAYEE
jgi:ferritin-like metal-binding protein YciE